MIKEKRQRENSSFLQINTKSSFKNYFKATFMYLDIPFLLFCYGSFSFKKCKPRKQLLFCHGNDKLTRAPEYFFSVVR